MNRYKRLGKNLLLLLTGNFVTKVLSFLMVPFYTSILSTADYGISDLISSTVLLVLPFFSLLMDEAIMRFALEKANDQKQVFSIALSVSTAGFILALGISPIILLFNSLRLYYGFIILYYISLWMYNIMFNYVKGLDRLGITTIAGILHTTLYLGINILCLAVFHWGVYGYLLAIDLSNLLAALFLFFYCQLFKNIIPINKLDWTMAKKMIKYSLPMIPDYISWWVNNASDRYVLAALRGASATGVYSVAYKIPTILNSLTGIFSSAWKISSVDNFGSKESINFYNRIYRLYSGFLVISGALLILFTKILAKVLFAKGFFEAWHITPILILSYIFSAQAIFLGSIFTASKKTKTLFWASLSGAIVNIILNFILIPPFSGSGAAVATAIGYFVILTIDIINIRKILIIDFNLTRNIISYICIITEIISILADNIIGYSIAACCAAVIILNNINEFIYVTKMTLDKIKG